MNNIIHQMKNEQVYPCLVYFIVKNQNYKMKYTIDDIEEPSEELYEYYWSDQATLGRPILEYAEWKEKYKQSKLETLHDSSMCELSLEKTVVESFDDIRKVFSINNFVRLAQTELDQYFRKDINDEQGGQAGWTNE